MAADPVDETLLGIALDLRHQKPWHFAEDDSLWVVTGVYPDGGRFTKCLARVVPSFVSGTDVPVFEILLYGDLHTVVASDITAARELLLVEADDPLSAYFVRDQPRIDKALAQRDDPI